MTGRRSLSLKYRPGKFGEIVGQEAAARTLSQAVSSGSIHQAYLFHGPRGSGKTSLARILAKTLNCSGSKTGTALFPVEPCGVCSSCQDIAEGRSLDVLEIDAASHTGVDHVREVILDTINLAAARDPYRVFIIDEVHMLSTSAFNAMLKTLEEPPEHVVFILATTEFLKMPATIVSRTQSFPFRALSLDAIENQLLKIAGKENIVLDKEALQAIARQASGSLRDAISLLEQLNTLVKEGEAIAYATLVELLGFVEERILEDFVDAFLINPDKTKARKIIHEALYRCGYAPSRLLSCLYERCSRQLLEALSVREPGVYAHRLYLFGRHLSSLLSQIRNTPDPLIFCEVELFGYLLTNETQASLKAGTPPGHPADAPARGGPSALGNTCPPEAHLSPPLREKIPQQNAEELSHVGDEKKVEGQTLDAGNWQIKFQEFLKSSTKETWGFYFESSRLTLKNEKPLTFQVELTKLFNLKGAQKHEAHIRALWKEFFGSAVLRFAANEQQTPASPASVGSETQSCEEIPEDVKRIAELFGGKVKKIG